MTDDDELIERAVAELYGIDPGKFTAARNALAKAARAAGAAAAAEQITSLRRPTRAAWILNQLARSQPDLARDFGALAEQLRQAHVTLDGAQIRELSKQRRQLIDQTTAQALQAAAVPNPTAALRDDVSATLGAVLADPAIAARFAAGALAAAEDPSGFGPAGAQLSAVPELPTPGPPTSGRPVRSDRDSARRSRHAAARAKAENAVTSAVQAKQGADASAADAGDLVRQLTEQLADAKRREDDALLAARHAELRLEKAQQALDGLNATPPADV